MTRRRIAMLLTVLVALCGVLPVVLLGVAGLEIVRDRGERASQEALQAIAEQAGARIEKYVDLQRELLRTLAMAVGGEPDAVRRLRDATLDAPRLGKMRVITPQTARDQQPHALSTEQIAKALTGREVASETYLAEMVPAMDVCVPTRQPQTSVCATLDLLELQREAQHIRVGASGYALTFDRTGHLIASGSGTLRAAVLTGEPVAESPYAAQLAGGTPAPKRLRGDSGEVIAGWAFLPNLHWTVTVEQPVGEALHGARAALLWLSLGAATMLILSVSLGYVLARRMLQSLELEERFRTAGQIAAGITHDLGHRLAILQQTKSLAETNDPAYLPRIRDSLASEVETLKRFVSDFADLTRQARPADFLPIELNAFAESVKASADPYATQTGVRLELTRTPGERWVRGDRYMLERAALNLVRNAIEASPAGSRVLLAVTSENGRAALHVEDQGAGIAAARLPTLFDSFSSTKRTGAHVGMGLPNVRRIVVAHGGAISVKSAEGRGSTFTLALPITERSQPPQVT